MLKYWMSLPKHKLPSKENKSYKRLKIAINDQFIVTKLKFFENIAKVLNDFFC